MSIRNPGRFVDSRSKIRLDESQPLSSSPPAQESGLRLLVVESNRELFDFIALALRRTGGVVTHAATAAAATAHICRLRPDVVISNVSPADESGWLMVGKWRLNRPHLPVWFYASETSVRDQLWADFVRAEQMLYYGDNWRRLTSAIIDRLTATLSEKAPA